MRPVIMIVVVFAVISSCRRWTARASAADISAAEDACRSDDQNACGMFAEVLRERGRFERAWALATASCDAGSPLGCATVGGFYVDGQSPVAENEARGAELLTQGCDYGAGWACSALGLAFVGLHRHPEAEAAFTKACAAGVSEACTNYGWFLDEVWKEKLDRTRARAIFVEACDGGSVMGCRRAGVSILNGFGGTADWDAGFALLENACYRRDPRGCQFAGLALMDAGRSDEGVRFLRRSCALGDGCMQFAQAIMNADAGPMQLEAYDAADTACRKLSYQCAPLAQLQMRASDPRAFESATRGCVSKEAAACELLRQLDGGLDAGLAAPSGPHAD